MKRSTDKYKKIIVKNTNNLKRLYACPKCHGSGANKDEYYPDYGYFGTCQKCDGKGIVEVIKRRNNAKN